MKIFFDTTYRRDEKQAKNYKRIYNQIEKLGNKHVFTDIAQDSPISLNESSTKDKELSVSLYHKRLEYLHDSDINMFEASTPSLSTGLLIEKSLDMNKPTIVFYLEGNMPVLVAGIENEKLLVVSYSENNLEKVVKEALIKASQIRDKRFNFFISPMLLEYIERKSKELGITKSKLIRNLILKHMKNK